MDERKVRLEEFALAEAPKISLTFAFSSALVARFIPSTAKHAVVILVSYRLLPSSNHYHHLIARHVQRSASYSQPDVESSFSMSSGHTGGRYHLLRLEI